MPQQPSRRIVSIQVCRGLAALLVVLTHIHGIEETHFTSHHLRLFGYADIGVDIFFVISGIVIASVTAEKFGSPRNAAVFLYHRLARIFPSFGSTTPSASSRTASYRTHAPSISCRPTSSSRLTSPCLSFKAGPSPSRSTSTWPLPCSFSSRNARPPGS